MRVERDVPLARERDGRRAARACRRRALEGKKIRRLLVQNRVGAHGDGAERARVRGCLLFRETFIQNSLSL